MLYIIYKIDKIVKRENGFFASLSVHYRSGFWSGKVKRFGLTHCKLRSVYMNVVNCFMNIREIPGKEILTTQSSGHRLEEGDIIMSPDDQEGSIPPPSVSETQKEANRLAEEARRAGVAKAKAVAEAAAEEAERTRKEAETAEAGSGGKEPPKDETATGAPGEGDEEEEESVIEKGKVFEDLPEISTKKDDLRKKIEKERAEYLESIKDPAEREKAIDQLVAELEKLGRLVDQVERSNYDNMGDLERAYYQMGDAVARGEVDAFTASRYTDRLAQRAAEIRRLRVPEERQILDRIIEAGHKKVTEGGRERNMTEVEAEYATTEALKKEIDDLNPDRDNLSDRLLNLIAANEEAAEKFLDKIISKPYDEESSGYRLSWYADINLQSFMTQVKNQRGVDDPVYRRYIELKEVAHILHETNRATSVHSGDVEAIVNMARSVRNTNLQAGVEIDGVEQVRQLLDKAFGGLYANENELREPLYEPQIIEKTKREFKKLAQKGRFKSKFTVIGSDGNPHYRNLEDWEINRAFVIGRNFHTSFYRVAELTSWGHVPPALEEWLKSMKGEQLVRVFGGYKYLADRFRAAQTQGGPEFCALLTDSLIKEYESSLEDAGLKGLSKLGKLSIREDLKMIGIMSAGGFDKGWRTVQAYLGSELMEVNLVDLLNWLPPHDNPEKPDPKSLRTSVEMFIRDKNKGKQSANFGDLLINLNQFRSALNGEKLEVDGVLVPPEKLPYNEKKASAELEELLMPLLGFNVRRTQEEIDRKVPLKDLKAFKELKAIREKAFEGEFFDQGKFEKKQRRWEERLARMIVVNKGMTHNGKNIERTIGEYEKAKYKKEFDVKVTTSEYVTNKDGDYEYQYFDYDRSRDQINYSLGVLISQGSMSDNMKTILWRKTAKVLPARIAYFLSEEGVKELEGYNSKDDKGNFVIRGEEGRLFSEDFEDKLIDLEFIRLQRQKEFFEKNHRHEALKLEEYFDEAGLTESEKEFVIALQNLGQEKSAELARVPFPHVPFLDDVPFQEADYIKCGSEVYPRRAGSDFTGYYKELSGMTKAIQSLASYEKFDGAIAEIEDAVGGPEGPKTAQDTGGKFYRTYFRMAMQRAETKFPGVKTVLSFLNKSTSVLQDIFAANGESLDARAINLSLRKLAQEGKIRFKRHPGEKTSQMMGLQDSLKAKTINVFLSEAINALAAWFAFSFISFPGKVNSDKK